MICKKVLPRLVLTGCGFLVGMGSVAAAIDLGQTPASSGTGWQLPPDADAREESSRTRCQGHRHRQVGVQGQVHEVPWHVRPRRWA